MAREYGMRPPVNVRKMLDEGVSEIEIRSAIVEHLTKMGCPEHIAKRGAEGAVAREKRALQANDIDAYNRMRAAEIGRLIASGK